ncbi:hypothetical protein [Paenibacillus sp. BC26]|uniref:hypothetical protein n=1 Tax=Paenibacillus sp. BC26 TaxID=1881032 RepID=UPI0008E7116A|nr:hypothetical protein [Paenibacillus sp. BC26]SFS57688.1 hypothetical protein SAMN05428962_1037 [Paenibacillus sp. BC26]
MKKQLSTGVRLSLTAALSVAMLAGCSSNNNEPAKNDASAATNTNKEAVADNTTNAANTTENAAPAEQFYYDMYDKVTDSSDFPDWKGKQLKLKMWYSHGTGEPTHNSAEQDVVTPEAKRVTGVEIDQENSFDNGGQDLNVKMGMLNAANDWPDIVMSSDTTALADLVKAGKVYDLTDVIAKYAPNLAKRTPFDKLPKVVENITVKNLDGKTYGFPLELGDPDNTLKVLDPSFVSPNSQQAPDGLGSIWVRDDLLKKLYPIAKTQDEIDALYVKNGGKFSREELYDVPIKSKDDFYKFLYDMQAMIKKENIKENGKPVETSYAFGGGDNWSTLTMLQTYINRIPANNNYFTYYDKKTKEIEFMFQQEWFKQTLLEFNKLVRDKVMDPKSLLENQATHTEKMNNGQYAVAYLWDTPDESVLKAAGKKFRYRKVFMDAPVNTDTFISPTGPSGNNQSILIFKDKVAEEDLPQIIHYLDYMVSEVGEKMYTWGPRSAGLFDETDGKRVFKDKDLEDAMVYNKDNGANNKYNLHNNRLGSSSKQWPPYPTYMWGGSTVTPSYAYDRVVSPADGLSFFNPGNLPNNTTSTITTTIKVDPAIWNFFGPVPSADKFWKGRDAFEKALTKTMAAKDDAQFEELWKTFSDIATKNGANDQTLKEINDYFLKSNEGMLP